MKAFIKLTFALMGVMIFAVALNVTVGLPVPAGLMAGTMLSLLPQAAPQGALRAGVLTEIWTGELIDHFKHESKWLGEIPERNDYVENDAINLTKIGADPNVLINNTTYPIPVSGRTDTPIVITLDKFDTENTAITKDELYALPYDKTGSVLSRHRIRLEEDTAKYGMFNVAVNGDSPTTPVIPTTGSTSDIVTGRKDFSPKDLRKLKHRLDLLDVPMAGRILVLHPDHSAALLDLDNSFKDKYTNTKTGEVINHFGFKLYEDSYSPYRSNSNAKLAWGAVPSATDRASSTFFYAPRAVKARGTLQFFYRLAENDPENRRTVAGYRLYHVVIAKDNTGFGAIVSDATA
jgi:hypothetical protein